MCAIRKVPSAKSLKEHLSYVERDTYKYGSNYVRRYFELMSAKFKIEQQCIVNGKRAILTTCVYGNDLANIQRKRFFEYGRGGPKTEKNLPCAICNE